MTKAFRLYASCVMLAAAGLLLTAGWTVPSDPARLWNALAAFAVVCFISEAYYFRLRVGKTETQSSVAFIPYIASFLLFDSGWAALITGASMFAVEFGVRRKPPIKILFNTAQVVVAIASASHVFSSLGGVASINAQDLRLTPVAVSPAIATYFFLNSTAVSLAVTLALGEQLKAAWVRITGASIFYDLFSSPLGVFLAYLYARFQLPGIIILVLPLWFVRRIYQVNLQLEQVNRDLLELMVKAIEARDPYTSGHSQRVALLAELLARQVGLGARMIEQIRTAALLHDVGKIHEEYALLLRKEGRLDATEKALMRNHSTRSAELVGTISAFHGVITDAVRHHHENYDGTGYPMGLAGNSIPIGARIIMIGDTVDAMTTDRPYRKALSPERVTGELRKFAGSQFDPHLVEAFSESAAIQAVVRNRTGDAPLMPPSLSERGAWRPAKSVTPA